MPETSTITNLSYCIIASSAEEMARIRSAFESTKTSTSLIQSHTSVQSFILGGLEGFLPDFIALDESSLLELENQDYAMMPVVLFKNGHSRVTDPQNIIFEEFHHPVNHVLLENTIKKIERIKRLFGTEKEKPTMPDTKKTNKTFLTKKGKEFILLSTDNIPAFYTDNKITFAYDNSGKKFMINLTLIELENSLDPTVFFRANRQFLINRNFINRVKQLDEGRFEIIIESGEPIHVDINQQKFSRFRQWIENP